MTKLNSYSSSVVALKNLEFFVYLQVGQTKFAKDLTVTQLRPTVAVPDISYNIFSVISHAITLQSRMGFI